MKEGVENESFDSIFLKKKWCLDLRHGGSAAGHRAGKFDWQEKKQRRAVLVLDCRERESFMF